MDSLSCTGVKIAETRMAINVKKHWGIEPWPTKKRRRGYRVVCTTMQSPCCYRSSGVFGDVLFIHPDIVRQLREDHRA